MLMGSMDGLAGIETLAPLCAVITLSWICAGRDPVADRPSDRRGAP